jgi:AraC-like DNA-binding protein
VVPLPRTERRRVRRWFSELEQLWREGLAETAGRAGLALETAGLSAAILGVHRRWEPAAQAPAAEVAPGWREVERAVRHIQRHYMRAEITLAEIAGTAGVTPNYLCRIFMRNMGCTVMDYLAAHRMEHAEMLLLTTPLNCSQVADRTGFSSLHVFSHAFSRLRGEPPARFRNRHVPPRVG